MLPSDTAPVDATARRSWPPPIPEGLAIRDAHPDDNDALIALERETPLLLGNDELVFDRSPDFFARHRLHDAHRVVVAVLDGEIVGVEAAAVHEMHIGGVTRRMTYINHSRIRPDAQGRGVAAAVSAELMAWGRDRGAHGPYWYIHPANERSIRFGGRGGGRWPADAAFRTFDVSAADGPAAAPLDALRVRQAIALINGTHDRHELFAPHSPASFSRRLTRDPRQYGVRHLRAVVGRGRLLAVAGIWDSGRCIARIRRDASTGATTSTRTASVVDWGYAAGERDAFRDLLRGLAYEARCLARTGLLICAAEDDQALFDVLPSDGWRLSLFTPTVTAPQTAAQTASRPLFADLIYV
jgi:GNAT superfamily N-acetyltransferase